MAITIYDIITPLHIGLQDACFGLEGNVPCNNTDILAKNYIEIEMTNVCFLIRKKYKLVSLFF